MKKILFFISSIILLFTASCAKFPDENKIDFIAGPKVDITIINVDDIVDENNKKYNSDSTICFKLKTTNDAAYVSYLVTVEDETILPENLLKGSYNGVLKGTIKYKEEETLVVTKLKPFTVYQIYAVSSHKEGGVGELSNSKITTTDNIAPRYVSRSVTDKIIEFTFSESVVRGAGKVFVSYYSQTPYASLVDEFTVREDSISVSDNVMSLKLSELPAGAHVCITWEKDAVKDFIGNPVSEITTKGFIPGTGTGSGWQGYYLQLPFILWDFETLAEVEEFSDLATFRIVLKSLTLYPSISRVNDNFKVSVTYKITTTPSKEYKLEVLRNNCVVNNEGNLVITLPQTDLLVFGALISVSVNEGSYTDKFGNGCNYFELIDMYKYVRP